MNSTTFTGDDSLAIHTQNLGKRFGSRAALHDIDLEVPRGCAFGFLGPNGAGKTTLIRLLLGLAKPTSGRMRLLGHELPLGLPPPSPGSGRSSRSRGSTRISPAARTWPSMRPRANAPRPAGSTAR